MSIMKKSYIIACSLLLFCAVRAQDTIDYSLPSQAYRSIPYTFRNAFFDSLDHFSQIDSDSSYPDYYWPPYISRLHHNIWRSVVTKHYPTNMPPIYGIGIPLWQLTQGFWNPTTPGETTQLRPVIAVKESDSLYLTTYGRIVESDQLCTRPPDAYIKAPYYPTCDTSYEQWSCSNVYYLYFDSAVTMSDSFYFGVAIKGPCGGLFLSGRYGVCEYPSLDEQTERLLCPFLEQYDSTVFSHARPYSEVAEGTFANIPFILLFNPPDTDSFVCPEVENFTYLGIQGFYPTFMWTSGDGVQQYEVCYGPYDADVNTLPTVTVDSTNVCVLTDRTLSPDIYYQARCRAVCHHVCPIHDTVLHTPWSAPQYFYMGSSMPDTTRPDTTHQDTSHVALPPSLSPLPFTLSPNPAHGNVTLLLPEDALPANVVMRDAAGREVLRRRVAAPQTTLSTRSLPAGLYHVTVFTPTASATRKLTVR